VHLQLFDNCYDDELVEMVAEVAASPDVTAVQAAADAMVQRACDNADDESRLTPFSEVCTRMDAEEQGLDETEVLAYTGGKPDDITCTLAVVVRAR
jgi:hypothetical protein